MIALQGRVELAQGPVQFEAGPWEFSQWEQFAARKGYDPERTPMTFAMYIAYAAVHRDQWPPKEGYEVWSRDVKGVDLENDDVPPTESAASDA